MKTTRAISESSTTSDNTAEFIEIVKKYDIVYNNHNPDYKNVEVKLKIWSQIADEIGLSVDASKKKWKNLRDSYTKYLRSYRSGGKTSKKYQFWAHAEHMDFLKPYQGPGRTPTPANSKEELNESESNLVYPVVTKVSTQSQSQEEVKQSSTISSTPMSTLTTTSVNTTIQTVAAIPPIQCSLPTSTMITQIPNSMATSFASNCTTTSASSAMVLPLPSLPSVPLPPQFSMKPLLPQITTSLPNNPLLAPPPTSMPPPSLPPTALPPTIFPLPQMSNHSKVSLPLPPVTTATSVGCLIFDPQILSTIDSFKKDLGTPTIGLLTNLTPQMTTSTSMANNFTSNSSTKIRRVQPSPQSVMNSSFTTSPAIQTTMIQPPPAKSRKVSERSEQIDLSAILQANRELDSNTLFFLSLASTVRSMPTKFQSLAKMRCMRIVSDIELELENAENNIVDNSKSRLCDTPSPPNVLITQPIPVNDSAPTEHFVYCMSPSRLENMIDISSDDETSATTTTTTINSTHQKT